MFTTPVGTCEGGEEAYRALRRREREIAKLKMEVAEYKNVLSRD